MMSTHAACMMINDVRYYLRGYVREVTKGLTDLEYEEGRFEGCGGM